MLKPGYIQLADGSCTDKEGSLFLPTSREKGSSPWKQLTYRCDLDAKDGDRCQIDKFLCERCDFQIETGKTCVSLSTAITQICCAARWRVELSQRTTETQGERGVHDVYMRKAYDRELGEIQSTR